MEELLLVEPSEEYAEQIRAYRRTILSNGGVYDSTAHEPDEDIDLERYWITL